MLNKKIPCQKLSRESLMELLTRTFFLLNCRIQHMRMTPAQIAVTLICGEKLPPFGEARIPVNATVAERIKLGRQYLREITKADFGYDLVAWHAHLKESREGGYTWGRNVTLPNIMKMALDCPEWQSAVRDLRANESA